MNNDNVLILIPKKTANAHENMQAFISLCQKAYAAIYSDSINWSDYVWRLGENHNTAYFCKITDSKKQSLQLTAKRIPNSFLDSAFVDFAKSYVLYEYINQPSRSSLKISMAVLKVLEKVLIQVNRSADVTNLNLTVLNECIAVIRKRFSASSHHKHGRRLEKILAFLNDNCMLRKGFLSWSSPLKPLESSSNLSATAEQARKNKLPDGEALKALAEIFSLPDDQLSTKDILTSSVFALLMCAPGRISEVLSLPVNCEYVTKNSAGEEQYGLKYYSGKGYGADIKWVPSAMVPVAKKAISRMRKLSQPARKLAAWAEENTESIYRFENTPNKNSGEPLTDNETLMALGFSSNQKYILNNNGICKARPHNLSTLWQAVREKLPHDFPWYDRAKGIKYRDALFLLNHHQASEHFPTLHYELFKVLPSYISKDLNATDGRQTGIFGRHHYMDSNGNVLKLKSHQARHLLNTIAQRGNLSELSIAMWSGRALVSTNHVYNHVSDSEMLITAQRLSINTGALQGLSLDSIVTGLPSDISVLNSLDHGAIHITEFGYCVHDYSMSPCEKFRNCLNCSEQVCIKGDEEKLRRLQDKLEATKMLLTRASEAMSEDEYGADRWVQQHEATLNRMKALINVLKDDNIADGSPVRYEGQAFTHAAKMLAEKINIDNQLISIKKITKGEK